LNESLRSGLRIVLTAETDDPFDTGPRDAKTGMLQVGQEFANDKWNRR
jgi:hypothetical protein